MFERDEYEDQLIGDPNQLDNFIEGRDLENGVMAVTEEARNDPGSEDEKKEKKNVKRVLNPQPKLDTNRLTGPKGIVAIEGLFKDFEFRGPGYEDHDLNRIMKALELWGNRLFPKLQFDDLLEKVEKLGHKRPVLNFVSKVRMGLVNEESVVEDSKEKEDVIDDDLNENSFGNKDDVFEQLLAEQQTEIHTQPIHTNHSPPETEVTLTAEQMERMMCNRRMAEERRLMRIKAQQDVENSLVPIIKSVANLDEVVELESVNISTTYSVVHESDRNCVKESLTKIREVEGELEAKIENTAVLDVEMLDSESEINQNNPKESNTEKEHVTEFDCNENKDGEIDVRDGNLTTAEISCWEFCKTSADVNEGMVVDFSNSVGNNLNQISHFNANSSAEHVLFDDNESIKTSEVLNCDSQTGKYPQGNSELKE